MIQNDPTIFLTEEMNKSQISIFWVPLHIDVGLAIGAVPLGSVLGPVLPSVVLNEWVEESIILIIGRTLHSIHQQMFVGISH